MVIINSKFLTQNLTGVQRVSFNISKILANKFKERFLLFAPKGLFNPKYAEILKGNLPLLCGQTKGLVWEQIELPLFAKQRDAIILNLGNSGPIFYKKNVVVIHDLLWLKFPQAYSRKFRAWYGFMIPKLLKNASKIITVSKRSRVDILEHFNISEDRLQVVYPSVDVDIFKLLNLKRENFILWVGSMRFYKNIHGLLEAFKILKNAYKIEHKLALVGSDSEKVKGIINKKLAKDIIFIRDVDDIILLNLYNRATLFVFPSLYEGFGLPPLEAMACGCPAVVSNAGSLPEVCGDAVVYCNPYDPEDIARAMYEVLNSEDLRNYLVQKGFERVKMFSWEKTAREILKIIEEVV